MKLKLLLVLALLFTFALAGCAPAPDAAPAESADVEAPAVEDGPREVTLTMWTHDGLYVEFFTARAEEWAENYPDIDFTFDFEVIPDIWTVTLANLAAGEDVPDLFGMEQGQVPAFMRDGILADKFVDLTDLIGDDYERVVEGRWTPYTYQGRVYGVDSSLSAATYYYQPEIFESRGLEVPATWNEFLTTGEVLAQDGIALSVLPDGADLFMMYLLQRGGAVFDDGGEFVLGDEENRQAALDVLELMKAGIDNGSYLPMVGGDFWGASPITAFREGRAAGIVMPDWYGDFILKLQAEDMEGQWRQTPMPVWDDGEGHVTTVWGGTGFSIFSDSENADLAWDLLKYSYLTNEGQVKRFEEIGYYPTMSELFEDPRITDLEDTYFGGQRLGEVYGSLG